MNLPSQQKVHLLQKARSVSKFFFDGKMEEFSMPRYSIDENGNVRIIDDRTRCSLEERFKRITYISFWIIIITCIVTYLVFYIDLPAKNYAINRIQTQLNLNLCTSSFFQSHLHNRWLALVSNAENVWAKARDFFLTFRQEVR